MEAMIRLAKIFCLLQNGGPGKPGLIDLQDETLKKQVVVVQRKTILSVVVAFVIGIFGVGITIVAIGDHTNIVLSAGLERQPKAWLTGTPIQAQAL
jgi:hypothetical protein